MPARSAAGTILSVGTATDAPTTLPGTDTFTAIGLVSTISGPQLQKAQIDVTPLSATTAKEFIADIADPGTLDFTIFLDGPVVQHRNLFADAQSVTARRNWRLTLIDGTIFNFVGSVIGWSLSAEQGSAVTAEVSVQISGTVSVTWGT